MGIWASMRQWGRLKSNRRMLLAQAAGDLILASLAIRLLPFRQVMRLVRAPSRTGTATTAQAELRSAIEAVAGRLPWSTVCFEKGLAMHRMLRRRGVPAVLHYGIAAGARAAHVWVEVDGQVVIGGEALNGVAGVATFPVNR